ncbi:MAG: glutamate formimidoyltransferase [Bacteroidetes bacterium]|nr:glutamate formimidoyltransferase [Bacteroidota bacterium]
MKRIVECVPNFSEGRRGEVIDAIADAVRGVADVQLLSAESDRDYNRTVVTLVGVPEAVVEAAFQATRTAAGLIDMRAHKGEHPRLGATDVVPFVPVAGVSMDECVALAHAYGKRVGEELRIPIYLYEEAATSPGRKNLAAVRKGEYEGLPTKLKDPEWKPDYGPAEFNPKSGATVTGARMFLVAYNVNLNTADVKLAHEIALRIRQSGRVKKDGEGKPILDDQGKKLTVPGTLKAVKAMGVLLEAHNIAQVSMNLVDFAVTPPHVAYEEVCRQAATLGAEVAGSEVVGLTPKEALLMAGRYYAGDASMDEQGLIDLAIERLGLQQLEPFDLKRKVIEYNL